MNSARIHPLLLVLAAAVLILSAVTIAAVTGVLPTATSKATPESTTPSAASPPSGRTVAPRRTEAPRVAYPTACSTCGVLESIRTAEVQGDASGLGAVAGGLTGAIVGNQFGRGSGRTVMTIAGAAGGAYAGNSIEKNAKKRTVFRVTVRLDDGTVRTLTQSQPPPFAVGERVRIVNGNSLERA